MKWGAPHMLWLLAALLPAALVLLMMLKRRVRQMHTLIAPDALPSVAAAETVRTTRRRLALRFCAAALFILALARPQWGFHWEEVRQRGLNIIVALDTSNSMLAQDLKPDRLQQSKWAVRDLVQQLNGDRIGLVAFAGDTFLQCPLTTDYAAFLMQLDDLYAGIIPRGGTDTAGALEAALESFEKEGEADRVIILISDGESHEGDPLKMTDELKKNNVRVFSIGVGTPEGELIPIRQNDGTVQYLKDREGKTVKTRLEEKTLRELAMATGGFYVRAAPGDFGLETVYREGIRNLRKDEKETRRAKVYEERYRWFLLGGLLLLASEALLREKRKENR